MSETSRLHNLCNGLTGKWQQKKLKAYPRNKKVCGDHVALVAKLLSKDLFLSQWEWERLQPEIGIEKCMVQPYLVYNV
jgi:hypothetical protein